MELVIKKYGGKLLGTIQQVKNIAHDIAQQAKSGNKIVVVVSALGDHTNQLIALAKSVTENPAKREYDLLLSGGEQNAAALLSMALIAAGCPAKSYTGWQAGIRTKVINNAATIVNVAAQRILGDIKKGYVVVVAGFQGVDDDNNITTLERGGSDLTAVALAGFLRASKCEIYKDTGGVYTADPHVIADSKIIPALSYEQMLAIVAAGSKLLQLQSVKMAKENNIVIHIMDAESNQCGSVISNNNPDAVTTLFSLTKQVQDILARIKNIFSSYGVMQKLHSYRNHNL
jgi:aspartate kinase